MTDLDPIRRMLDDGVPIPPWLVRGLCERVEALEFEAETWKFDARAYRPVVAAARAWADTVERGRDIAVAEDALREAVRGL